MRMPANEAPIEIPSNPFLNTFRWYRKRCGGHWEVWTFHAGEMGLYNAWVRLPHCTLGTGLRPLHAAGFAEICEDYAFQRA